MFNLSSSKRLYIIFDIPLLIAMLANISVGHGDKTERAPPGMGILRHRVKASGGSGQRPANSSQFRSICRDKFILMVRGAKMTLLPDDLEG